MIKLGYLSVNADFDLDTVDYKSLTHINLSFATVSDLKGNVIFNVNDKERIKNLVKENDHIHFNLAIGGWSAGNFSEAVESDENINNFVTTTMALVEEYQVAGVDLDWEYPCSADAGISAHPSDKQNYTKMMTALRKALDEYGVKIGKKTELTFAMGAVEKLVSCMELDKLNEVTDYMNLMSYDMGGSFVTTGHHTNLLPSEITGQKGGAYFVNLMDANGYPKSKIALGCGFYGRGASGVRGREDGIYSRIYGTAGLYFNYDEIMDLIKTGNYTEYIEEGCNAKYLFDGDTFITYETPESVLEKCEYARANDLKGVMFWEIPTDKTGELLNVLINEKI